MILEKLMNDEANFADVIAFIEDNYTYTVSAFTNENQKMQQIKIKEVQKYWLMQS